MGCPGQPAGIELSSQMSETGQGSRRKGNGPQCHSRLTRLTRLSRSLLQMIFKTS